MPDASEEATTAPARSTFVSVLGWLGVILFGFSSVIGLLQNIMVRTVFHDPTLGPMMTDSAANAPLPAQTQFMFSHMQLLVLAIFACSLVGLAASIGLLQRRNWARLTVIGLLSLGIAWNLFSLFLQQSLFNSMSQPPFPPADAFPNMAQMFRIMRFAIIGLSVGICALCGWLIARLASSPIRAEFVRDVA